jgi:type II secretory pathway pseudopilin PulG
MNTLTPLNPDIKPEQLPERPNAGEVTPAADQPDPISYADYNVPTVELESPLPQPTAYVAPTVTPSTPVVFGRSAPVSTTAVQVPTSGFLVGYIASLFAGVSVLYGLSTLGFILLDHFINRPAGLKIGSMFDASGLISTWHVWLISSLLTFTVLYLILSGSAGKHIAAGLIPERQLQAAEVARSVFTAVLVVSCVSLVAGLLFTLLNSTLAAAEVEAKAVAIQVVGSILTFIWVGIIIWHQSAIHQNGRNGVTGAILATGVIAVVLTAAIFLLAAGRNAVIDSRTVSDLSTIQSKLMSYQLEHEKYPTDLASLKIEDESIAKRLSKYTYTQKEDAAPASSSSSSSSFQSFESDDSSSDSIYDMTSYYGNATKEASTVSTYKLCANFLTDTAGDGTTDLLSGQAAGVSASSAATFTTHPKGQHCVEEHTR